MDKNKLMQLLKDTYNSGYEDGFVEGANGVKCNVFDDVIYENMNTINELCESQNAYTGEKQCNLPVVMPSAYGIFAWADGKVFGYYKSKKDAETVFKAEKLNEDYWFIDELVFTEI